MDVYDITIVGGGPTGLFGSFYAGLRGLKTKIIDVLPELGGQLTALYPEKYVYDVAGHPKILAKDLAKNLAVQAQLFKPAVVLGEKVLHVETIEHEGEKIWQVKTDKNTDHFSKTILLALGAGACVPKKLDLDIPNEWEESCVFYAVKNKDKFKDKKRSHRRWWRLCRRLGQRVLCPRQQGDPDPQTGSVQSGTELGRRDEAQQG